MQKTGSYTDKSVSSVHVNRIEFVRYARALKLFVYVWNKIKQICVESAVSAPSTMLRAFAAECQRLQHGVCSYRSIFCCRHRRSASSMLPIDWTNGRTPNRYINAKQRQQMSQEPFVLHLFYFILDVRACLKPGLRVGCPYVATVTHRLAAPFIYIRRPRFRDTDIQLLLPVFSPLLLCCLSLIYPVMDKS